MERRHGLILGLFAMIGFATQVHGASAAIGGSRTVPTACWKSGGTSVSGTNNRICNAHATVNMALRCPIENPIEDVNGPIYRRLISCDLGWKANGSETSTCAFRSHSLSGSVLDYFNVSTTSTVAHEDHWGFPALYTYDDGTFSVSCTLPDETSGGIRACIYGYGGDVVNSSISP